MFKKLREDIEFKIICFTRDLLLKLSLKFETLWGLCEQSYNFIDDYLEYGENYIEAYDLEGFYYLLDGNKYRFYKFNRSEEDGLFFDIVESDN